MKPTELSARIDDVESRQEILENGICLILEAIQGGKVPGAEAFKAYIESERAVK